MAQSASTRPIRATAPLAPPASIRRPTAISVARPRSDGRVAVAATGANANLILPGVFARTLNVQTAGGSVSQVGVGATQPIVVTGNAAVAGAVTINATATGGITLNASNSFNGTTSTVNLTG